MEVTYTILGDGKQTIFPIRWPTINRNYVRITRNGEAVKQGITWLNDSYIQFSTPPAPDEILVFTRCTPRQDSLVIPQDGTTVTAENLRTNQRQSLHVMQEVLDQIQGYLHDLLNNKAEVERILNLTIHVEGVSAEVPFSSNYDPEKNILLLKVPQGLVGEKGNTGSRGQRGERGFQGTPGAAPALDIIDGGYAASIFLTTVDCGHALKEI